MVPGLQIQANLAIMCIDLEDISITLKYAKISGQIKDKTKDQSLNDLNN